MPAWFEPSAPNRSSCSRARRAPIAVRYAAEHPRQVERLVLYGSYLDGSAIADPAAREMLTNLIRSHWGLGSRVLADVFIPPSATAAERDEFVAFQRDSASAELAARSLEATYAFSVEEDSAGQIWSPTALLHRRNDRAIPFELGRQLAARIPGAVFAALEGADHLPLVSGMPEPWRGQCSSS